MMMLSCFEVFKMVAGAMDDEYLMTHKVNEQKEALLRTECEAFDKVASEVESVGFTVLISEETRDISISLEFMYDLCIVTKNVPFLDLIRDNTKAMMIDRAEDEDVLKLTFVFDPIWD